MNNTTNINIRINPDLKQEADNVFSALGLTMSAAVNLFLRKTVQEQGIPFEVSLKPNADTIAAMKEAEAMLHDPNSKTFHSVDELWEDLLS